MHFHNLFEGIQYVTDKLHVYIDKAIQSLQLKKVKRIYKLSFQLYLYLVFSSVHQIAYLCILNSWSTAHTDIS